MRALHALLAVWSCLLCQTATSQSTTSTAVVIGDDGPGSGGIVPIAAPPGATGDSPFPTSGDGSGFALDVPQPTDLPDASSAQKPQWIHPTVTPSPVTVPKHKGSHMQTYQARQIGAQILVSAHSTWVTAHSVYLDFLPNPLREPKSVYTEVEVVGKSSTVVVEPTATVVTLDGHVFPVVHTDGPSPLPSHLIHTAKFPPSGSAIMVPAPAQATQESLVSALLIDPEPRISDSDGDGDRKAKKWKRIAIVALAVGGASWLLLPLLCCCMPRRRKEKVVEKTTSTDPATGLTVVTTSTSPASNGTGTTMVETTERGTLTRQAEEGRGRLSQVIGSGGRGNDTGTGAGTAAGLGAAAGAAAGSRGGNEGSSGGSGAGQGSGSASGAEGTSASGTRGGSGATGDSGAAGGSSALGGADAKSVATEKKLGATPASAEHVEAVPVHDGADSLRTGSEMVDIGSLRGRRKMRPDSRGPF